MSLFNTLNTSISGMAAQASKLSTIGDNIANVSTTGYKDASTEFQTLLGNEATSGYESGGVQTKVRYAITDQGTINNTTSSTDLAISGNGFFVVQDGSGATAMTRAGSFVPDKNGNLVNTAGYTLMGYNLQNSSTGLEPVNINTQALVATPSSSGTLSVNLPATATAVAANQLPSTNASNASYTDKTSLTIYDNLGKAITADIYMSKTGNNTWEVAAYNSAGAASGGSFPYAAGSSLGTQTLTFDSTTGKLAATSGSAVALTMPSGKVVSLDMTATTQLASNYALVTATVNGNAPSKMDSMTVGKDGTVTAIYANGTKNAIYQVALANVVSPENLTPLSGNAYQVNSNSGSMVVGAAGSSDLGLISSGSLESSTVDLATELTSMISAQRGYEANSKVLQTTSDLLKIIDNLQV